MGSHTPYPVSSLGPNNDTFKGLTKEVVDVKVSDWISKINNEEQSMVAPPQSTDLCELISVFGLFQAGPGYLD